MSVLAKETAINPDKNLWFGIANDARSITGTTTGITSPILNANQQTILNTSSVSSGAGVYIIIGSFQWSTNNVTATVLRGFLTDTVSGALAQCDVTSASASSYSASCVLTVPTLTNVVLQQYVSSNQNGNSQCRAQWSVIFLPSNT